MFFFNKGSDKGHPVTGSAAVGVLLSSVLICVCLLFLFVCGTWPTSHWPGSAHSVRAALRLGKCSYNRPLQCSVEGLKQAWQFPE